MKYYSTALLFIVIAIAGCTTNKFPKAAGDATDVYSKVSDTVRIANDELEYEVIIIDPGFNSWLASRARPRNYYTQQYLETKNKLWIIEWNTRAMQPQRYSNLYEMRIDYDPFIDYGYEVNYLIYNYLVYFQISNNQKLGGVVPL